MPTPIPLFQLTWISKFTFKLQKISSASLQIKFKIIQIKISLCDHISFLSFLLSTMTTSVPFLEPSLVLSLLASNSSSPHFHCQLYPNSKQGQSSIWLVVEKQKSAQGCNMIDLHLYLSFINFFFSSNWITLKLVNRYCFQFLHLSRLMQSLIESIEQFFVHWVLFVPSRNFVHVI